MTHGTRLLDTIQEIPSGIHVGGICSRGGVQNLSGLEVITHLSRDGGEVERGQRPAVGGICQGAFDVVAWRNGADARRCTGENQVALLEI